MKLTFHMRVRGQRYEIERKVINPTTAMLLARLPGRRIPEADVVIQRANSVYEYQKARLRLRIQLAGKQPNTFFIIPAHHILRFIHVEEIFFGSLMPDYTQTLQFTCTAPFLVDVVKASFEIRVFWWSGSLHWQMKINGAEMPWEIAYNAAAHLGWNALTILEYFKGV